MFSEVFIISLLAGGATGIGALLGVIKRVSNRTLGILMGFAGGIMLAISFTELLFQSINLSGITPAILGFAAGALFIFAVDSILPHIHFSVKENGMLDKRLFRFGMLLAIGITIHNIPEGMVVGAGYSHLPALGILVAIGIALHNIPEGMVTAFSLYQSGTSRKKAFLISFGSGLVEPIGAMAAYFFLSGFPFLIAPAMAFAAGAMIFITLDELLPIAKEKHQHFTSLGVLLGIIFTLILSKIIGV